MFGSIARLLFVLLVGGLAVASPTLARASQSVSPEDLPLSNEAAMTGGTVLAGGRSAGSFWYNPALLGRIHQSETEANAEAYGLHVSRAERGLALELPDGSRPSVDLESREFVAVPTTVAGAFAVSPKLTLGFGLFNPVASTVTTHADIESAEGGADTRLQFRHQRSSQRYHLGLGVGWSPSEAFQLGASIVGTYDDASRENRLLLTRADAATTSVSTLFDDVAVGTFGLAAALGVRGRLAPHVFGAAQVRSPSFVLVQTIDGERTVVDGTSTSVDPVDPGLWRQRMLSGWQVSTGVFVDYPRWRLGLDLDATTAARNDGPSTLPSFGASLGGMVDITKRITLGTGVFHRRRDRRDDTFGATQLDRWGGSLGIELRRRLELRNRRSIVFRTVVALWYAYGRGTVGSFVATSANTQALARLTPVQTPARTHLIAVHIGSSLAF